jgi:hypothetical protein
MGKLGELVAEFFVADFVAEITLAIMDVRGKSLPGGVVDLLCP